MAKQTHNRNQFTNLTMILMSTAFLACSPSHDRLESVGKQSVNNTNLSTSAAAFGNTLYPVLKVNCALCHAGDDTVMPITNDVQQTHNFIRDLGFVNFSDPQSSAIVTALGTGHTDLDANLPASLQTAIENWANQIDIVDDIDGGGGGATVTLSSIRSNSFNASCVGCHSGDNPAAGLSLDNDAASDFASLQGVINTADPTQSELYQRLISNDDAVRMPRGADPLSQQQIDDILTWITEGGLNN